MEGSRTAFTASIKSSCDAELLQARGPGKLHQLILLCLGADGSLLVSLARFPKMEPQADIHVD